MFQFSHRVDIETLLMYLDEKRIWLGMSWNSVATEIGCTTSTFSRMRKLGNSAGLSSYALVSMLVWLDQLNELDLFVEPQDGEDM